MAFLYRRELLAKYGFLCEAWSMAQAISRLLHPPMASDHNTKFQELFPVATPQKYADQDPKINKIKAPKKILEIALFRAPLSS